ncbi:MAG TPA: hypothetical protein VN325_33470 [Steroidobacteraceae bacterium]|nr:hypothetical protein [Steroidobacteraceae bacterium]
MALISQMDPTEAGELLYKKFMAAHEANRGGSPEDHPSRDVQKWNRIAATGGTGSEKRIEKGEDDQQPEITENGNAGATPAMDSAARAAEEIEDSKIRNSGSATMASDLWAARARRSDPRKIRAVAAAIPGYDRLK